jgi:DinB family protein
MTDEIAGPDQARLFTRIAVNTWKATVGRFDDVVAGSSDEDLEREVTPGKSRLAYLIGHLTALHDRLLPVLGLGERRHAELDAEFAEERDDHRAIPLSPRHLRQLWNDVNAALVTGMERLTPEQWLEPPASGAAPSVAAPNRLSVLLAWTAHVSLHATQLRITR